MTFVGEPVPLVAVSVSDAARELVNDVLDRGQLAQGPVVAQLEQAFARACGVRHCLAVSNGTVALEAALQACGIGPGDEVITTPFSFVATVNAILAVGASVTFVDIDDDFTLDPAQLEPAVSERTKAVMPVHLYGLPARMDELAAVAQGTGLRVIEDAAQAHGARVDLPTLTGFAGGLGDLGCFSLYATKNLSAGEGGLITTNDDELADRVATLRNQGMRARYDYAGWGNNWRMSDLHAAVVVDQVDRLAEIRARRAMNAARLIEGLSGLPGIAVPAIPQGRESAWHQFTIRVLPECPMSRDQLHEALAQRGISSAVFYPMALCDVPHIAADPRVRVGSVDRARQAAAQVLSLPVGQHLSSSQLDRVIDALREVLDA